MNTFAELLTQYIRRAGITDTELARTVGVSRQTIFRWREGLTGRPNKREDILAIADKLRLSPEERDNLFLAGGFRPDENIPLMTEPPALHETSSEEKEEEEVFIDSSNSEKRTGTGYSWKKFGRFPYYLTAGVVLIVLVVWLAIVNTNDNESALNTLSNNQTSDNSVVSTGISPAISGESLVLVTTSAVPRLFPNLFSGKRQTTGFQTCGLNHWLKRSLLPGRQVRCCRITVQER